MVTNYSLASVVLVHQINQVFEKKKKLSPKKLKRKLQRTKSFSIYEIRKEGRMVIKGLVTKKMEEKKNYIEFAEIAVSNISKSQRNVTLREVFDNNVWNLLNMGKI